MTRLSKRYPEAYKQAMESEDPQFLKDFIITLDTNPEILKLFEEYKYWQEITKSKQKQEYHKQIEDLQKIVEPEFINCLKEIKRTSNIILTPKDYIEYNLCTEEDWKYKKVVHFNYRSPLHITIG